MQTPEGKAATKRQNSKPETKARVAKWRRGAGLSKVKVTQRRYNARPEKQLVRKAWRKSPKGKAIIKGIDNSVFGRLRRSLHKMVKGTHPDPVSLVKLGCFDNNADVDMHFRSTFKPWMTIENNAVYRNGDDYDVKWNIGHRLPVRIFDEENIVDAKRCFSRHNLYAQCARENVENNATLVLSDVDLIALKDVWPESAEDSIEKLKMLYLRKPAVPEEVFEADSESESESESEGV